MHIWLFVRHDNENSLAVNCLAVLRSLPGFPASLDGVVPADEVSALKVLPAVFLDEIGVPADSLELLRRGYGAGEVYLSINEPYIFEVFVAPLPIPET